MAFTGFLLLLFLFTHAAGNATIYLGFSNFQEYADLLHSHPLFVASFSTTIFVLFLLHGLTGIILFLQNSKDRFCRYKVSKRVVANSFASKTMVYTGLFILLFVIIHVWTLAINRGDLPISDLVFKKLSHPQHGIFYLISFIILSIHLSHGIFSMLQTLGINHPRYNKTIGQLSYGIPIFFLTLFSGIVLLYLLG